MSTASDPKPARKTERRRSPGEGSIYYDKSKDRWVAAITIDGKRRKRFAPDATAARRVLKQMDVQVAKSSRLNDGNLTVANVIDYWVQNGLATRTVKGKPLAPGTVFYHEWIASEWKSMVGSKRVDKLEIKDVEDALAKLAARDDGSFALGTLRKARTTLSLALTYGMKHGKVNRNVALLADIPAGARRPVEGRSMTVEQAVTFIRAIKGHELEAMFLIMVTVGPRPSEAAGLTWDNVDLTAGKIKIAGQRRTTPTGGAPTLVTELKTHRAGRTIDLAGFAFESLRAHRAVQLIARQKATKWADPRLVFATSNGTLFRAENVRRSLRKITVAAGLGVWTPNELRHTAASLLVDGGVPLKMVADVLGHADTRMVDQTYGHRIRESVNTATVMERIVGQRGRRAVVVRRHRPE